MSDNKAITDAILEELHESRRVLLTESGGTLTSLVAEIQRRERESGGIFSTIPLRQAAKLRALKDILDETGERAAASGITPQIINSLLASEPNAEPSPLAPPAS